MSPKVSLFNTPPETDPVTSVRPLTFEALNQSYGFLLYEKKLEDRCSDPAVLSIPGLHDRAIVYLNKASKTIYFILLNVTSYPIYCSTGFRVNLNYFSQTVHKYYT